MPNRFFYGIILIPLTFVLSFAWSWLFPVAQVLLLVFTALILVDALLIFIPKTPIKCHRFLTKTLSLGSVNNVKIIIQNNNPNTFRINLVDELPFQLQIRKLNYSFSLTAQQKKEINYHIRPTLRGLYGYGAIHTYISSRLGLLERRITHDVSQEVAVYPSIIEMKKYELMAMTRVANITGIKRIRRLGHSYEFEQIKNYVKGDDYQCINWKATSRTNNLMVNHYEDEKSQQVYAIIDKSRAMKMPFNGMTLLDYAINTSLVISKTAVNKQDKIGLISFSNVIDTALKASKQRAQMKKILESLYREKESLLDANYELLYRMIKNFIRSRSLIFLFTNFENLHSLHRVLSVLRKIGKLHLLVVVIFENTEIIDYSQQEASDMKGIYYQTIAQKFISEKHQIVKELTQYGIQTILSKPEDLSINTINKYLELKSRGMI